METYLSFLILFCLQKINGERTTYSIYHLLKGKKSSQTIQDAHLFQLTNLFQSFPHLNRNYFDEIILDLLKKNYIQKTEGDKCIITKNGMIHVGEGMKQMPLPQNLNGWKHHSIQEDFWKRLSLFIQVCSNLINFESSYIPIQHDIKTSNWLKATLLKLKMNRDELAQSLLQELITCLSSSDKILAEVVVSRLTGHNRIGLTPVQAAEMFNMDSSYFHLQFINSLHFMIENIASNKTVYPILENLLMDSQKPIVLTRSSLLTYRYLQMGQTMDEISTIRNLKLSTIEDHIVEIALNDSSFYLEPFVPIETENMIKQAIQKLNTKQLKMIRQELDGNVTYFQIRLVLAKLGEQL